jgi:Protein of unknown function (DUF998)
VLLVSAGVVYSMWILEFILPTGLSPLHSFVSEHYVVSQPYHTLFRSADIIAGLLYVAASGYLARLLCRDLAGAGVAIGLGVFGLTTVTDAVFVPDCIATIDRRCEYLEFTGQVSWHHLLHLGSSVVSQIAIIFVALGIEHLATVRGTAAERILTRLLLAILLISGLGCVAFYKIGWVGIPQRMQLVTIAAGTIGAPLWLLHARQRVIRGVLPSRAAATIAIADGSRSGSGSSRHIREQRPVWVILP